MAKKSAIAMGLEVMLNDKRVNAFADPTAFRTILKTSEMKMAEALRHIGKKSKTRKPSDNERSQARLERLEGEEN